MRVARRVRPSHVGCGATVSRRRLYAASSSDTTPQDDALDSPPTFWSIVIHPDGSISPRDGQFSFNSPGEDAAYESTPALAGASARGR
jgi:hypothetical protein